MALFHNAKDRDLSRLTTLFQVDDYVDEANPQSSELFGWLVKEKGQWDVIGTPGSDYRLGPKIGADRESFWRLKAIHDVAKQIMLEMHTRHSISTEAVWRLSKLRATMPPENRTKTILFLPEKAFTEDGQEWVAPQYLFSSYMSELPFDYNIGRDIVEELVRRIQDTPEAFAACPECESIYLRLNPRTVYCSARCGQRHLMRERQRKQKKEIIRLDKPNNNRLYSS